MSKALQVDKQEVIQSIAIFYKIKKILKLKHTNRKRSLSNQFKCEYKSKIKK